LTWPFTESPGRQGGWDPLRIEEVRGSDHDFGATASVKLHNCGHPGLRLTYWGIGVPGSGIIELAIGLVIVFGVASALTATATEAVVRLRGLRGAFLLRGLYELLDGSHSSTVLGPVEHGYRQVTALITGQRTATDARAAADAEPDNKQLQDTALAAEAALAAATAAAMQEAAAAREAVQAKLTQPGDRSPVLAPNQHSVGPSATSALLGSPILRGRWMNSQGMTLGPPRESGRLPELAGSGSRLWRQCRSLPPYIPAESFAGAVMDLLMPDATEEITMATVRQDVNALPDEMTAFKQSLQALVKNAANDVSVFRTSIARWFDHEMDHVSREYKRHITRIVLAAGTILVVLLNINALAIGRYLYSDFPVDSAVTNAAASAATNGTSCPGSALPECLAHLRVELSNASQLGLPVAWATVAACTEPDMRCNWLDQHGIFSPYGSSGWQLVLYLTGLLLTVLALLPGARFWFSLLNRLKDTLGLKRKSHMPRRAIPVHTLARTAVPHAGYPVPSHLALVNLAQSSGMPVLAIAFIAVATGFGGSALPETARPAAREPCAAAARRP